MTVKRNQALKLLTATELDVFEASLAENLRALDARQLRAKIRRARTLRDKYQELLRREAIAMRVRTATKTGRSGFANESTAQKAQVFEAVVQRFEKRLAAVEAAAARAAGRTAPAAVAAAEKPTPKRPVPAKLVPAKRGPAKPGPELERVPKRASSGRSVPEEVEPGTTRAAKARTRSP